jgi:2-polyprenyl-6-hydroxyphenyl methylase/3-demethylubiquinone-9 3-methyltransferase
MTEIDRPAPYAYYSEGLCAERLELCYELAPAAVQRYLEVEIERVLEAIAPNDRVLELGCGYGRAAGRLARKAALVTGIDLSFDSLRYGAGRPGNDSVRLAQMDASRLGFRPGTFDVVCCVQNGVSAFHVDERALLESAISVTKLGGKVLFFSYADELWAERLAWFRVQAAHGLVGEIDEVRTGDGTIVCRDGFTATTVSAQRFAEISAGLGTTVTIEQLERASVVCEIVV